MKRSSKWDETSIENQLRKLPKIEDAKSKDVLFAQIQERLQSEQLNVKKSKRSWYVPALAGVAVLFLLILIVPSFLNERDVALDDSTKRVEYEQESGDINNAEISMTEESAFISGAKMGVRYMNAIPVNEEHYYGGTLVPFAVSAMTASGGFIIPVTVTAEGATLSERFMVAKEYFSGESWGVGNFPDVTINSLSEASERALLMDLPNLESLSSLETLQYELALVEAFSRHYQQINFLSEGKQGVSLGQYGFISELDLKAIRRGYQIFETNTGHQFLVKDSMIDTIEQNLKEALAEMKYGEVESGFQLPIPNGVEIVDVKEEAGVATITFSADTILADDQLYVAMIEAILLTAGDFGNTYVKFEGIEELQIGSYFTGDVIAIPRFVNFLG